MLIDCCRMLDVKLYLKCKSAIKNLGSYLKKKTAWTLLGPNEMGFDSPHHQSANLIYKFF